jgi:hypothetical protein
VEVLNSGGYGLSSKADGIRFVSMKPGVAGKSNVGMKGKGGSLPIRCRSRCR